MDVIKRLSFEVQGICDAIVDFSDEPFLRNITNNFIISVKEKNVEDILYMLNEIKKWYARNQTKIQSNDFVSDKEVHIDIERRVNSYISELNNYDKTINNSNPKTETKTGKKIFISHSSKDEKVCTAFVLLLEAIGISENVILYSSSPRHGIPGDEDIFSYLRRHISEGITVFYMLSDNYYESVYCLNEMGAAWIAQNDFSIFLLPNFTGNIKGVIDSKRKGFNIVNPIELTQLKRKLTQTFNLTISEEKWEEVKNNYLKAICE